MYRDQGPLTHDPGGTHMCPYIHPTDRDKELQVWIVETSDAHLRHLFGLFSTIMDLDTSLCLLHEEKGLEDPYPRLWSTYMGTNISPTDCERTSCLNYRMVWCPFMTLLRLFISTRVDFKTSGCAKSCIGGQATPNQDPGGSTFSPRLPHQII